MFSKTTSALQQYRLTDFNDSMALLLSNVYETSGALSREVKEKLSWLIEEVQYQYEKSDQYEMH